MLRVASDYTQLAVHALAYLPIAGAASLYAPRYHAWAREALPRGAWAPLERDARLIAAQHDRAAAGIHGATPLQWMPALFESIAQLRASAAQELRAVTDVADERALHALRAADPIVIELVRAAMLLAAPAYARSWPEAACAEGLARARPAMEEAVALDPALARVELVWALGPRGRALGDRVLVGVPGDWSGLPAESAAVVALHEASVRRAGGDYVHAEWRGLTSLAARMTAASEPLRAAHAAWLARLDLDALAGAAAERGLVSVEHAARIAREAEDRVALLAASAR